MSLIRKHGAVLQAWACLDLVHNVIITFKNTLEPDS